MVPTVSGPPMAASPLSSARGPQRFAEHLSPQARPVDAGATFGPAADGAPASASGCRQASSPMSDTLPVKVEPGAAPTAAPGSFPARALREVQLAQARMDRILELAESGRSFSPAELLALQAHAYRAGQELEMAGKVVEKGLSAVKQTLQTQL